MHRVAFRLLNGGIQTAVLNHTVDVDGLSGRSHRHSLAKCAAPATGTWTVNQQSTYAPGTTDYRWMGSIATDQSGGIALGFSASSGSIFPSIRYAGRLFTDTLSTLPQAEITMTVGLGAQTGSGRWGDYTMLGVDPQDGCTFWYTKSTTVRPPICHGRRARIVQVCGMRTGYHWQYVRHRDQRRQQ
jgi:hypothetical protein